MRRRKTEIILLSGRTLPFVALSRVKKLAQSLPASVLDLACGGFNKNLAESPFGRDVGDRPLGPKALGVAVYVQTHACEWQGGRKGKSGELERSLWEFIELREAQGRSGLCFHVAALAFCVRQLRNFC